MRAVFFGTPNIAVPALKALGEVADVVGVVCQPDRPSGRGLKVHAPPVKLAALSDGIEVYQPRKVKTGQLAAWLSEHKPDVGVVMAYGRILPRDVLIAPRLGCINLHASLLPRFRGAAPIVWAIMRGESQTGITLMQMDEGLDTGPMLARRELNIDPDETGGELAFRLGALAAEVVRHDLPRYFRGELSKQPQDEAAASYAPPLTAEHYKLDFLRPASELVNQIRALAPKPGARTRLRGKKLTLLAARVSNCELDAEAPGTVRVFKPARIVIRAGDRSAIELFSAQLEGKRPLTDRELINGRLLQDGDLLTEADPKPPAAGA